MRETAFTRRHPASANAVLAHTARTAYARDVEAVSEEARQAIGQEVCATLHAYREGDNFVESIQAKR